MKRPLPILLCSVAILSVSLIHQNKDPKIESVNTGIILDSMNNEVLLVLQDGEPLHYKSEIFTPVCNTGECLPIYINLYWTLDGKYLKFDQPKDEILTKLDHVPFTDNDYTLLDEILQGPDPRLATLGIDNSHTQIKHSEGASNGDSEAQPNPSAPAKVSAIRMEKHLMVDGISGATLPEIRAQFVPGALYTTYTIWGLANDSQLKMRDYTRSQLFKKYEYPLIVNNELMCRRDIIDWMALEKGGENARMNILIELIESKDSLLQEAALTQMYFDYYAFDEVQKALDKTFYGESAFTIQRRIILNWTYNVTTEKTLIKLSKNLVDYEQHFTEMMAVFEYKQTFPKGVVKNMIDAYPKLKEENQKIMKSFANKQKDKFSEEDWDLIKKVK